MFGLQKELARPVNRGYVCYPGYSFTYGIPNIRKDGGVAEGISIDMVLPCGDSHFIALDNWYQF